MTCVINYNDILGAGSYGVVCKAKLGELSCAAKLLRWNCSSSVAAKFLQECQLLRDIKHPRIIQYLGTPTDPRTGMPVLLMELMDENLTSFLERSLLTCPLPISYNTQLNICHDIALALSYLHSNAIIHRDLSSNNVLLSGSRAKLTDFGMSKLVSWNPQVFQMPAVPVMCPVPQQMTQFPGTLVYMPPEASGIYTTKLDCFSFGVLTIQILTKMPPNPAALSSWYCFNTPYGQQCKQIMNQFERYTYDKNIDLSHPLWAIALDCLKHWDMLRPSANELCRRLETLKNYAVPQPYSVQIR